MDTFVQTVAVIAALILALYCLNLLTEPARARTRLRHARLGHYKVLLGALSELGANSASRGASHRLAQAVNALALEAPQKVVEAVMHLQQALGAGSQPVSKERLDELTTELLLVLRADLALPYKDDAKTFAFHVPPYLPKQKDVTR